MCGKRVPRSQRILKGNLPEKRDTFRQKSGRIQKKSAAAGDIRERPGAGKSIIILFNELIDLTFMK